MFKQFKDVKAREETEREESVLEKLITLGDELIKFKKNSFEIIRAYIDNKLKNLEVNYDEKDIISLMKSHTLMYDELNNLDEKTIILFGIYSGCLLTKLTKERHAQEKISNIIIDNLKQHYILFFNKEADQLTINNCEGNFIGSYIGFDDGNVKKLIINNCKSDSLGWQIGSKGYVDQVIINDCKGAGIGDYLCGGGGKINQLIINNCEGDDLTTIGQYICIEGGRINQIIINNCKTGDYSSIGYRAAYENGTIGQLIINNPEEIEKQGLTGLIELVDSLTGKTYQEVQQIAQKIGEYSNV